MTNLLRLLLPLAFAGAAFAGENFEQTSPNEFQDKVIRAERLSQIAKGDSGTKAAFAKAAALFYSGDLEGASAAYEGLLGKDADLDGSILIRMAKIQLNSGEFSKMRATLKRAGTILTTDKWEKTANSMRAEASLRDTTLNDAAKADSLAAFLNKYQKGERSTELRFEYAKLSEKIGKTKQAKKAYLRVLGAGSPKADSAFAAVQRLHEEAVKSETLEEKWAYAKLVCNNGKAEECLSLIDEVLALDLKTAPAKDTSAPESAEDSVLSRLPPSNFDLGTRKTIWEKRAVALRSLGKLNEAYKQFKFLLDSVEQKPLWMQSALKLLRNDEAKNAKAIAELDSALHELSRYSKENANNLWLRGFEFEQKKNYVKAIQCYKSLNNQKFGSNNRRQWAAFRIGLIYFKEGNYAEAEKAFLEAKKLPFTWSASGSRMFLGDTYLKQGKDSLARAAYLECIKDFPLGYYAHRSRTKLKEAGLMKEGEIPMARGQKMSDAEALEWVRKHQKKMPAKYSAKTLEQVKKLLDCGFIDEATDLYQAEFSKNSKQLDFLYEYGTLFMNAGETALGYRLARAFQNRMPREALANAPEAVLKFLYPTPYRKQVLKYSGTAIDPFFVYSVMRQESIFDFQIASPAGARGLLQIMPATGKALAQLEGIEGFDPDMLYNAYLNIRLGIRYLVDLKREYSDDYMYVLGNYNAGPKPTKRWQNAGKGVPWDIRAEDISYWETRDYVKRVMGNYWIYEEIWGKL